MAGRLGARGLLVLVLSLLAGGCTTVLQPGPIADPVENPVVSEPAVVEPTAEPEDPYRPDLGRPGFETPDIIMRCGEHQMSINFTEGGLELALDGGDYVLAEVEAEDGRMYSDGNISLWNLDTEWGFFDESTDEAYECFVAAIGG